MLNKMTMVITAIIIFAEWANAFGQDYNNEILTMFTRGTVDFPEGKTTATIGEIGFTPSEIKDVIIKYDGETMTIAFPDYKREDSIFVSPIYPDLKLKQMELDLIYKIYLTDSKQRDSLNIELEQFDEVLFSQNNGTIELNTDDPYYDQQWGLDQANDCDIDAPEAWELETGGSDMSISILDDGVYCHEDLVPKVSGDGTYVGWHGTHLAGIAAANANNQLGIAGTNWNAYIYTKNIFDADYLEMYLAIMDILDHTSIRVFNSSWNLTEGDNILVHKAFAFAYSVGVAPVASRGNDADESSNYPATFGDWMISVGAMAQNGNKASYSSYGQDVDFVAPGGSHDGDYHHDIVSTVPGGYGAAWGTSMAAPFVTGIIALMHDYQPNYWWCAEDFEQILQLSAKDIYPTGYDDETGWGMVKAGAALDSIASNPIWHDFESQGTPYVYQTFPEETMTCYGWYALSGDGDYRVVRKEIRSDVNYENDGLPRFCSVHVWGYPIITTGYSYEGSINYAIPFCEVVPGSETPDGCILRTYVYEIWNMDHSRYYGERPTDHMWGRHLYYTVMSKVACTEPWLLAVAASPEGHPLVSWRASTFGDITNYYIYRKVEGIDDDFVRIADVPGTALEYEDLEYYLHTIPPSPMSLPNPSPQTPTISLSQPSPDGDVPLPLEAANAQYTVTAYDGCRESVMPSPVTIEVETPCEYVVGDVNGSGGFNGNDVTYCVAYFEGGPPPVYECQCTFGNYWYVAGDVNGSCAFNGLDVTYMVAFLKGGPALIPCPDCPPGGFGLLSYGNDSGSSETITSEMNSTILVETSRCDSSWKEIIADIYLISDDSVAFINIPLQWQSEDIAAIDFQPSRAISGWEEVHTDFGNGQLLLSAWNDLGPDQIGNEDPVVSNGRQIYLGQFTFSVHDTCDIRGFALTQIDNPRIGTMMLGHPNGRTFSLPNFRFRDRIFYPKETDEQLPSDYSVMQNYPNPFNAQTVFRYGMPQDSHVSLEIFDMLGRSVEILVDENQPAGYHQVTWNAKNQVSGTYFYILKMGDVSKKGSMTLLK